DMSFGISGTVSTDFAFGCCSSYDEAKAIALQPDGKILVAGFSDARFGERPARCCDGGFAVARYNADGTLDPSFGGFNGQLPGTMLTLPLITGYGNGCCGFP